MASTRKPPSVDAAGPALRGKRVAVALSGGVDSVVLLHLLRAAAPRLGCTLSAVHVHHGLSPSAGAWARFCRTLCRGWRVPIVVRRVKVRKAGSGIEAAARQARLAAFADLEVDAIALAHHLDDQAETVLLNLLRGAGIRGAAAMPPVRRLGAKVLVRPLLDVPRRAILAYARAQDLAWVEDESNRNDALARNFVRLRVGPLLERRFPRWREGLARAARHFASADARAGRALRDFLEARGLRAPSEAKLIEMLKQLTGRGARTAVAHDGALLRVYRGRVTVSRAGGGWPPGELRLRPARGRGIDAARLERARVTLRPRAGGERLQLDALRPRRTLKNLFQEAGVAPWRRERLPLLYCDDELVWVPQLGIAAGWQAVRGARGMVPEWREAV
jgi:tRNA(Ile)-lysidine synthase